ncbi:hypothetical protein BCT68_07785 [Vibrio breoganii]|nr:hypothetical protein BCT68_07785 [Vibrio breoganii]
MLGLYGCCLNARTFKPSGMTDTLKSAISYQLSAISYQLSAISIINAVLTLSTKYDFTLSTGKNHLLGAKIGHKKCLKSVSA